MSTYFKKFPKVDYKFGDEESPVQFQNLSVYIDILDQLKEYSSFYQNYQIQNNERPDHISYKLYENVNYGWTFWLLNDHIRQQGWPLNNSQLYTKAQQYYPNVVVRSNGVASNTTTGVNNPLVQAAFLREGNYVWFNLDNKVGKILRIDNDYGLIHVGVSGRPTNSGVLTAIDTASALEMIAGTRSTPIEQRETTSIVETYDQWDAPHHYVDANGEWIKPTYSSVDPYPFDWTSVTTEQSVSYFQRLREENTKLRSIKVLTLDTLTTVINEYNKLLINRIE